MTEGDEATALCEVWWARPGDLQLWHLDLLNETERGRWAGLHRPIDRARFAIGAALLRLAVAQAAGLLPANVEIDRTCPTCVRPHGKPQLPGTGLHASISHSGERIAVALTSVAPVGIDVEKSADVEYEDMAARILGPSESVQSLDEFYTTWCRKESVVKATGDGLRTELAQVTVSQPLAAPLLMRYREEHWPAATMLDLKPGEGHIGALTILTNEPINIVERDGSLLLNDRRRTPRPHLPG
jgi:4'-phosphopantetheinyl transferase